MKVGCKVNANPTDCIKQSYCYWCNASTSCITGNQLGPQEPCTSGTLIYSPPVPSFAPKVSIQMDQAALQQTKITVVEK